MRNLSPRHGARSFFSCARRVKSKHLWQPLVLPTAGAFLLASPFAFIYEVFINLSLIKGVPILTWLGG